MPHLFGIGDHRVSKREQARIRGAIKKSDWKGVEFIHCNMPGEGWKYWFAGPNQGGCFDKSMEIEVLMAVGEIKKYQGGRFK